MNEDMKQETFVIWCDVELLTCTRCSSSHNQFVEISYDEKWFSISHSLIEPCHCLSEYRIHQFIRVQLIVGLKFSLMLPLKTHFIQFFMVHTYFMLEGWERWKFKCHIRFCLLSCSRKFFTQQIFRQVNKTKDPERPGRSFSS